MSFHNPTFSRVTIVLFPSLLLLIPTGVFLYASLPQSSSQSRQSTNTYVISSASMPGSSPTIGAKATGEEFDLLYEDRYFYIDNRGLTKVLADLNGYKFKLTVDPIEVQQGMNTFLMPLRGVVNIDLFLAMNRNRNHMKLQGRGPPGADATILVGDLLFGNVDYVLQPATLPTAIGLSQNYPNPFNHSTRIEYSVPETFIEGTMVQLVIYDALGKRIRTLVDDRRFPGTFTVQWDGLDDRGELMSSGVYFYRVMAGWPFFASKRLMFLK